jgi:hypothetical protein
VAELIAENVASSRRAAGARGLEGFAPLAKRNRYAPRAATLS